jgi:hypothetical protein
VAGRKVAVVSALVDPPADATGDAPAAAPTASPETGGTAAAADRKPTLREQALADARVQALLEVFPAEIRDTEEM